jgi:hypothetical protein
VTGGANFGVSGINFTPNKTVTVSYYDPSTKVTPTTVKTVTAGCNGSFTVIFKAATGNLLTPRTDKVVACDNSVQVRCAAYTFTLRPVL